ncbi:surface carbohydrate biosynthesis protein [Thiohalospira halophila DSM 15071]|uniref:Surface carbohydrate biosynthesis protein n=2 Tax=Thiohalospira halophila TaxID=381300 RepID=A0A1I1NRR9_9GAMM|nr:surface carbohydrate biosynthesis protein [Thiohalospira halophila DSM 15071]
MTLAFIEAVRHLAESNDEYDIVLRPHPVESIEAWKVYLEGIPNVHVIREGSITAWVNNAFAVMHNGCTTALEATVFGKPVVTYLPFEQEYARELPNELGVRVESLEALSDTVNGLFHASQSGVGSEKEEALPVSVAKKVHLDDAELAAEKIVKVWESLDNGELSSPCNWTKFHAHLKLAKLRSVVGTALRNALPGRFGPAKENYKFPPMDAADIRGRISRLQRVLGLDEELECKLLSERTVLIRPRRLL